MSSNSRPTPLDAFFLAQLQDGSSALLPQRRNIQVTGTGASLADDPDNERTVMTFTGALASPSSVLGLRSTPPAAARDFRSRDGYASQGDGGGRFWVWSPTDTRTDDGLSVIQVTSPPTAEGRWTELVERYLSLDGVLQPGSIVVDGQIAGVNNELACTTSQPFLPNHVGHHITILGAGVAGATLAATITGYIDPGHVQISVDASTSVSGAQVVWGPDNLAALNAAIVTATSAAYARTALLIPRGIFCVSGRITVDTHGLTIQGDCRQRGANSVHDASVLALVGSANALLRMAGAHHTLRDVWLHGGNIATGQTLEMTYSVTGGVGAFTESVIENCTISNCAPGTAALVGATSSLQINKIIFRGCSIRQDPMGTLLNGTTPNRCGYWVQNPNGNAFEISYIDCIFYSAAIAGNAYQASIAGPSGSPVVGQFPAGSGYYYNCEFYDYTGPVFLYECCRHLSVINCYTESGSYPFFQESNVYPGFSWNEHVVAINTVMNTGGHALVLQSKQPFEARGCVIANPIQVSRSAQFWPVLDHCRLVPQDYANGVISTAPIDHPENIILKQCRVVVFQQTPSNGFLPAVNTWDHDPSQGWVSPLPYSVYGNARTVSDGVTNGGTTVTSATLALTPADDQRQFIAYSESAGIRWTVGRLTYVSPTQFTASAPLAAATGVILNLGATLVSSEQGALLVAANAALAAGLELRFPPGLYMTASQTFPSGLTMRFQPGAYLLITGAGASGAAVVINGKVHSDHNPFLGELGPTVNVANAYANFLTVNDQVDLRGQNTLNCTGNFDQKLPTAGVGAYIRTLTDTGPVLTGGVHYYVEQLKGSVFLADNQTAQTITYAPKNSGSTGTGIGVPAGKRQLLLFDGTNIVAAGAAA